MLAVIHLYASWLIIQYIITQLGGLSTVLSRCGQLNATVNASSLRDANGTSSAIMSSCWIACSAKGPQHAAGMRQHYGCWPGTATRGYCCRRSSSSQRQSLCQGAGRCQVGVVHSSGAVCWLGRGCLSCTNAELSLYNQLAHCLM